MATVGRAGPIRWVFADAADGDFAMGSGEGLSERRQALTGSRQGWSALRQIHSATVVVADEPADQGGARADAVVSVAPGAVLSVTTADCAPVLLYGTDGDRPVVGAAHAGWRGLYDGVLEHTVEAMRALGSTQLTAVLGPCISPAAYEFGDAELTTLALRFGPEVVGATTDGRPAFDIRAGVQIALRDVGVDLARTDVACTATDGRHFSWRAQRTDQRQASIIWIEP